MPNEIRRESALDGRTLANRPDAQARRRRDLTLTPPRLRVLIVEDQIPNSERLRIWVEEIGHEVCGVARTAAAAAELARAYNPDMVFMDHLLEGDADGVDAVTAIRTFMNPSFVFVTSSTDERSIKRILSVRPLRVLPKPADPRELNDVLGVAAMMKWTMGGD